MPVYFRSIGVNLGFHTNVVLFDLSEKFQLINENGLAVEDQFLLSFVRRLEYI